MSQLITLVFDDEFKADEVRVALRRMAAEGLGELEESAVISVSADGKKRVSQDADSVGQTRKVGHIVGILAAAVTGTVPLIGVATVAGWAIGRLTDHGVTSGYIKSVGKELQPGTSAVMFVGRSDPERRKQIIERLRPFGPKILQSDLPPDLEREIQAEFDKPAGA
jgi:uncharacterized membrane protein